MNTNFRNRALGFAGLVLILVLVAPAVQASTTTWSGLGDGWDWFNAGNWNNGVPGNGDTAIINSGSVLLTNTTHDLARLEVNGGTLTFSNWTTRLIATDAVLSGGNVTHVICDTNAAPDNISRVYLQVINLFVGASGKIDVNNRGYRGGSLVAGARMGQGPGGANNGGGAGYGGIGSLAGVWGGTPSGNAHGAGGETYGSVSEPDDPGSGGGGTGAFSGSPGRAGGGAVRIEASGTVTVNGSITASASSSTELVGHGSGGSIYIQCMRFASTNGTVRADGGSKTLLGGNENWMQGGAGGGGRVAIVYNDTAQAALNAGNMPQLYLSADGGNWYGSLSRAWHRGRPGTIYLTDTGFYPFENNLYGGRIEIPGFNSWSPASLTIHNGIVQFPEDFELNIAGDLTIQGLNGGILASNHVLQIGGDLILDDSNTRGHSIIYADAVNRPTVAGNLEIKKGTLTFYGTSASGDSLTIGEDFTLSGGNFRVLSGMTNGASPDYGALIDVGGDMQVGAGSWVSPYAHSTNGGTALFRMQNLTVESGGGFNANNLGYQGGSLPAGISKGYGPGGGSMYGGGGHGGRGGRVQGGGTYGVSNAPVTAGSGGGTWNNSNGNYGGWGGGAIRIEAEHDVILDGTLTANGQNIGTSYAGGGAGGSIFVTCWRFFGAATGTLQADGGNARTADTAGSGSGGGGRIAVWRRIHEFSGTANQPIAGDAGNGDYIGDPGTIYWRTFPPRGSLFMVW